MNEVYAALSEVQEEIEDLITNGNVSREDVQSLLVEIVKEKIGSLNGSAVDADINEIKIRYRKAYTMILSKRDLKQAK
jgi:hypothetical protein